MSLPPTTRRAPRWRWIAGGAAVVAAAVALVAVLIVRVPTTAPEQPTTAEDTVRAFLDALARADGSTARRLIVAVPSMAFLTDDALARQHEAAPIGDVRITDTGTTGITEATDSTAETSAPTGDRAVVGAAFRIGDHAVSTTYTLTRDHRRWLVTDGVRSVSVAASPIPGLTLFGITVAGRASAYVFPGRLLWGSTNPYLAVAAPDGTATDAADVPGGSAATPTPDLVAALSESGRRAVDAAVRGHLDGCAASTQADASTDRPGCVQRLYRDARPGSVQWTAQDDLDDLVVDVGQADPTRVSVFGSVTWQVTFTPTYGDRPVRATVEQPMEGTVDMSDTPAPTYTPSDG
ncbi:hypothetical protein [Gordonia sp. NPDC003950]